MRKQIHAPSASFLTRIQYYGLVCSLNDWRYSNESGVPIVDFRHTVFLLGVHGQLEHP